MATLDPENPIRPDLSSENQAVMDELLWAIASGQGEFSLLLLRCNYLGLREALLGELTAQIQAGGLEGLPGDRAPSLDILVLPEDTGSLYQAVAGFVRQKAEAVERSGMPFPAAIALVGFESLRQLDEVLRRANVEREKFRQIQTPLLWWVDDAVLRHIRQRMPDFKSWASMTYRFEWGMSELMAVVEGHCDRRLVACLERPQFVAQDEVFTPRELQEYGFAIEAIGEGELTPELLAYQEFERGCVAYGDNQIEQALQHYRASLDGWQERGDWSRSDLASALTDTPPQPSPYQG